MKFNRLPIALLFAMVVPISQAAVISIGDPLSGVDTDETITLLINNPFAITPPGGPPGTGTIVTPANAASLNFDGPSFHCGPGPELDPACSFTFLNQVPWGTNVYFYRYFTEPTGGLSDLFVIQGFAGTNPDLVTFLSLDTLTGNPVLDGVVNRTGATPTPILPQPLVETGEWQLAFNTGVDQYYIKSVPEPATLALLGLGLAGLGFSRRKQ